MHAVVVVGSSAPVPVVVRLPLVTIGVFYPLFGVHNLLYGSHYILDGCLFVLWIRGRNGKLGVRTELFPFLTVIVIAMLTSRRQLLSTRLLRPVSSSLFSSSCT